MSSSSERSATAELWLRRPPGTPAVAFAAALTGTSFGTLSDAVAISLASSPEAAKLLRGMDLRIRTLNTGVTLSAERCVSSVRGPVLWAETMTARANSLGSDDVFVCAAADRSFDTVENRVLVAALEAIAKAARALHGPLGERLPQDRAARIAATAAQAEQWRTHPRLRDVRATRLTGRESARLRGGHRMSRMGPVLAVRDKALEPFEPEALEKLSDGPTRATHRFLRAVLDVLVARGVAPRDLSLSEGVLHCGALTFRHPGTSTGPDGGVVYRGVALLPPTELLERLPWRERLPERGIVLNSSEDVERLLERLAARERERRPVAQVSGSSSSSAS